MGPFDTPCRQYTGNTHKIGTQCVHGRTWNTSIFYLIKRNKICSDPSSFYLKHEQCISKNNINETTKTDVFKDSESYCYISMYFFSLFVFFLRGGGKKKRELFFSSQLPHLTPPSRTFCIFVS